MYENKNTNFRTCAEASVRKRPLSDIDITTVEAIHEIVRADLITLEILHY